MIATARETATPPASSRDVSPTNWWESRSFCLFLVVLAAVPLLYPPIPPVIDLPNHMGRYAIQLGLDSSPALQQWFRFEWKLIGNLGVDLLVESLAPLLGLEPAVKLIIILIPTITVLGFLWTAREVHGRVPSTAPLVVPLAYSYPFQFGFVNYCLAMAIAFVSYGTLLYLARIGQHRLRPFVLLVMGFVAWTAHAYGWAMLGLLWFVTVLLEKRSKGWLRASAAAILSCLPLAVPLVPMLLWRSEAPNGVAGWLDISGKLVWVVTILRDRWIVADLLSAFLTYGAIAAALIWRSRLRLLPVLLCPGLALLLVAMILPSRIFGSTFADVRLISSGVAVMVLSIAFRPSTPPQLERLVAALVLGFVIARMAVVTASMAAYSDSYTQELQALRHVPAGSRIASFSEHPCQGKWADHRLRHLANLAIGRREAFVNGQFISEGWNALRVTYTPAEPYLSFPSSMASPRRGCEWPHPTVQERVAKLPSDAFDYIWLLSVPAERRPVAPWLTEVWSTDNSALYRITNPTEQTHDPATGAER